MHAKSGHGPETDQPGESKYDQRFLLYVDILGWRDAIVSGATATMFEALSRIHSYGEVHNEQVRQHYIAKSKSTRFRVNPIFLGVQFGAFSDHFVFSVPLEFGGRILDMAPKIIADLLTLGFLTRGAVVLGELYHKDNVVFGPALVEAYDIERREPYPRIVVSKAVIDELATYESDPRDKILITDQTGRSIINPFPLPFVTDVEGLVEAFVRDNFHLAEIRVHVDANIARLSAAGRYRDAEKWRYMQQLIAGPVVDAEPQLKPFWP
jgi:hypothetical protein